MYRWLSQPNEDGGGFYGVLLNALDPDNAPALAILTPGEDGLSWGFDIERESLPTVSGTIHRYQGTVSLEDAQRQVELIVSGLAMR